MKKIAGLVGLVVIGSVISSFAADLASDANYKAKCAMCHGASGEGKAAMKTTPLKDVAKKSDADLTTTITKGKPPKMPGYEGKLTADQVKALVAEIKALK